MVTWEEAMEISNRLLPGEPGGDEIARWQACRPQPEPPKRERGLDTMRVDLDAEIRKAVTRERALLTEATGQALGEIRDTVLDEAEQLIATAVNQLRAEINQMREEFFSRFDSVRAQGVELRAEFTGLAQLRSQADTLGGELKAQLEIIARKRRAARARPSLLQLPGPNGNGNAHPQ
jgi:hypothetical protein